MRVVAADLGVTRGHQISNHTPQGLLMDLKELQDIRELIELVINASTKASAKPYVARLNRAISTFKPKLNPYFAGKLDEAADYAAEASGQVRNKERLLSYMEESWYLVESHVCSNSDDPADL